MTRILRSAVLAMFLAACGSSSGAGAGGSTTPAGDTSTAAAAGLAAKLGIDQSYVSTALSAAQAALGGGGAQKTPDEKAAAAQTGVDKAAAQAQADGKPLTDDQKSGLLEGLKGLL